jgi:hypothetical protein
VLAPDQVEALLAAVVSRDVYALHGYLTGRLGTLPIQRIETTPVVRVVKWAAMVVRP